MSWWTLRKDGSVKHQGVDHGTRLPILVVAASSELLVLKIPGGRHFVGQFMPQGSHPGSIHVIRVINRVDEPGGEITFEGYQELSFQLRPSGLTFDEIQQATTGVKRRKRE